MTKWAIIHVLHRRKDHRIFYEREGYNFVNLRHTVIDVDKRFADIIQLIKQSRTNAIKAANAELINLYRNVGEYISKRVESTAWGQSVVKELAEHILRNEPEIKGIFR